MTADNGMPPTASTDGPEQASAKRSGLLAYQRGRLGEQAYQPGRQDHLKRRVFDTFDALLRFRGRPGLQPGMAMVDLGASDGALVRVAQAAGLDACGFDAADGLDLEVDRLPLEDSSVDVVTCVSLIEHLYNPTMMLAEARRVLRPGGSIILVTPNWKYSSQSFFDDPTHVHPYTPVSTARVLLFHGFSDVCVVPWIVKKPAWMWNLARAFPFARWCLPFRGNAPGWIPGFLKGQSRSILAMARAPGSAGATNVGEGSDPTSAAHKETR